MVISQRIKLILSLSIILLGAFLTLIILNYNTAQTAIRHEIGQSSLPLLRENIYSEIEKDILPALNIASSMANDYFLIEWVKNGEKDETIIRAYLDKIHEEYGFFSAFFVSAVTDNYYHYSGINKKISEFDDHDIWYYRFVDSGMQYTLDVDTDEAGGQLLTIFINFRVEDAEGNLLGVTGVGIKMEDFSSFLSDKQKKYNRNIFLCDSNGVIQAHSDISQIEQVNIHEDSVMKHAANELLQNRTEPVNLDYNHNNEEIMISARYISDIKWFLVVVQRDVAQIIGTRKILVRSTVIGLVTTIIIILFSGLMINYFHKKLEDAANIDILTKAHNRRAFNNQLAICCYKHERYRTPVSVIMIDLDNFKEVNDNYGHKAGDDLLKAAAKLISSVKRPDDFFSRWGGDEFIILLESDISQAKALSERLASRQAEISESVTFSIGVTELKDEDEETFLKRVDEAMYTSKRTGKNRITVLE